MNIIVRKLQRTWLSPALLGLVACLCCAAVQAAEDEPAERSWNLGFALGAGTRSNPLVSGETIDINAVVDFSWYGKRFFFDNGDFGFTLKQESTWSLSLVTTVSNEREYYSYLTGKNLGLKSLLHNNQGIAAGEDTTDTKGTSRDPGVKTDPNASSLAPELNDPVYLNRNTELPDRDYAVNGGLEFLHISPWGDIQAQVLTDISSTYDGQQAWLSWSKPWFTQTSQFNFTLGLEWKSANLVDYYYGVLPGESFDGRPVYEGRAGTNRFIRFSARHRLGKHLSVVGMMEREYLSNAISDSPIIDSDHVDTVFAGLYYRF